MKATSPPPGDEATLLRELIERATVVQANQDEVLPRLRAKVEAFKAELVEAETAAAVEVERSALAAAARERECVLKVNAAQRQLEECRAAASAAQAERECAAAAHAANMASNMAEAEARLARAEAAHHARLDALGKEHAALVAGRESEFEAACASERAVFDAHCVEKEGKLGALKAAEAALQERLATMHALVKGVGAGAPTPLAGALAALPAVGSACPGVSALNIS